MKCKWCDAPQEYLQYLGRIGSTDHYRCRNCGADNSEVMAAEEPHHVKDRS